MSLYQVQKRIPLDVVIQRVSDITGCALKNLGPDAVLAAMGAEVHRVPDVDRRTDAELIVQLRLLDLWPRGASLAAVPELSYHSRPNEGFVVTTEELEGFALGSANLGESFFSCDCVVVGLDCEVIWALHHAGAWAHRSFAAR